MDINDFKTEDVATSLDEFKTEAPKTKAFNDKSISNMAAKSALLSGNEDVIGTYTQIALEMSEGDTSSVNNIVGEAEVLAREKNQEIVSNMLGDITINEEDREALAQKWASNAEKKISINSLLAEQAAAEDSSPFENKDEEAARIDMTKYFKEADNYRSEVQKAINSESLKNSTSSVSALADMLEVAIPFAEQGALSKIVANLREGDAVSVGKAFTLMGSSKAELRDWFGKMPMEKRRELIPSIIEIVKSSDTIIFDETNDILRNDFLRAIIDEGYYGTGSEIFDNAVNILDLFGLGGVVKSLSKRAKTVKTAAGVSEEGINWAEDLDPSAYKPDDAFDPKSPKKNPYSDTGTDVIVPSTEVTIHKPAKVQDTVENIKRRAISSDVQPKSISQVFKDTNPQKGRAAHAASALDETDQAAGAYYGTSRAEAVVDDILPEAPTVDGSVRSKLSDPDALIAQMDLLKDKGSKVEDVKSYIKSEQGMNFYFDKEKAAARSNVINDFNSVTGMVPRKEMFQFINKSDGLRVLGRYGNQDGGFRNAKDAKDLAEIQLRKYGMDEKDLSILTRSGENYVPLREGTDISKLPEGDYLVQVDYRYKFNPSDMSFNGGTSVLNNWFDHIPFMRSGNMDAGSVQSHLLDIASMVEPIINQSASAQVNKSSRLSKMLGDNTKIIDEKFNKLATERKNLVTDLIKEANHKGFDIDDSVATARGLSVEEKAIVDTWRETWDSIWYVNNDMLKNTFRSEGYMVYNDKVNNTTLYAKPFPNRNKGSKVYNPVTNKIEQMSAEEVNKLYNQGGEIAKLKTDIEVGGEKIGKIVSHNNTNGFLRGFTDSDAVLNKRKGYYQVVYKDPYFVEKAYRMPNGEIKYKAVGTAKTQHEADVMTKSLRNKHGANLDKDVALFRNRQDKLQNAYTSDRHWESIIASGNSAQRIRGKRLEDATGNSSMDAAHMSDPSEVLGHAISSISRRVEMKDWTEATKGRFMSGYTDVLPKDAKGRAGYPTSNKQISPDNDLSGLKSKWELQKEAADAATMWEYIRSMEDAYVNHIDESAKATMRTVADILGGTTNPILNKMETFTRDRAAGLGVTNFGKKKAFQLYLALNPLRQIIVQSHQMIQILGKNPKYMLTNLMNDATVLTTMTNYFENGGASTKLMDKKFSHALDRLGMTSAEAVDLYNDWSKSGLANTVDVHNLIRSDWEYATRGDFVTKSSRLVDKFVEPFQRVGFDAGERAQIMAAWLSFRDEAIRAGLNSKSPDVADSIVGKARNFTYNMDRAGDMPYNSNALGLALQFIQVPHKATTQVLFNRGLTKAERLRMFALNTTLYGTPGYWIAQKYFGDIVPEDKDARDLVTRGAESLILNKTLSMMSGDEVDIDWTTLAPADMYGTYDTLHLLMTSPIDALLEGPSAQLVGEGGRVRNLFRSTSRMFGVARDFEEDPTTFGRVVTDFAKLSSGFSNAFKSAYAIKTNEKLNTYGDTSYAVSNTEAVLQAFGFNTLAEATSYDTSRKLYGSQGKTKRPNMWEEDIILWYKDYKRHMAAEGKPAKYYRDIEKTFNEAFRVFPNNRKTTEVLDKLMKQDYKDNDTTFIKRALESYDWMDKGKLRDIVKSNESISEEDKKIIYERFEILDNFGKE